MICRRTLLPVRTGAGAGAVRPPKPPAVLTLTMIGSADQNPDTGGKAAPVAVRIYQLDPDGEVRARRRVRADRARAADTGTGQRRLTGICAVARRDADQEFELKPGVQAIGVVVLYRDIDNAQWRADAPVGDQRTDETHPERRQTCYHSEARLIRARTRLGGNRPMSWTNRVVWQEGMFLRTQHFQQQDRWTEQLVRGRVQALRPHPWGLIDYALDRDLLGTGRFALASATGVFEDGTPFALPGETDHPPPLELPESARNVLVYLALPIRQAGAVEVADSAHRGPLRRAAVRGLRHASGLAAASRAAGRPAAPALPAGDRRTRPAICASVWRA